MNLSAYREKRNFDVTNEPFGGKRGKGGIFSIQLHRARREHYDLRLEYDGALLSWAVPKGPSFDVRERRLAVKVEDHPVEYADFEGEIPKGQYGAGTVKLWDKGVYKPNSDFKRGLNEGSLKFTLYGEKLKGKWALVRMKDDNWLLIKEKDEYAARSDSESGSGGSEGKTADTSRTKRTYSPKKADPDTVKNLKKAHVCGKIPLGEDWLYEVKYDGYRIAAHTSPAVLTTRNGKDVSERFANIAKALDELTKGKEAVFDGEIVALKSGKPDFGALLSRTGEEVYFIFDLLYYDGKDLRSLPLAKRKEKLAEVLKSAPISLNYTQSYDDGEALFEAVKKLGMEGVVCKRASLPYGADDWLKVKCRLRQEFVICGFIESERGIRSLLLGVNKGNKLTYVGKVGSGLNERNCAALMKEFDGLITETPTLTCKISGVKWLVPHLMAEVEFAEWTSDGKIRQPSFKGIRSDKSAFSVKNESPTVAGIILTNPDKVVYPTPEVTKADIARYYHGVAKKMLPFLVGRPVSVLRCNGGIDKAFFKKHPAGDKNKLIYVESEEDIIREVQLGTVEFHMQCCGGSTYFMVFDLDPSEEISTQDVQKCALELKKILHSLNLKSFVKLSGGKGYHIVVPMPPVASEKFAALSRSIADLMVAKFPDKCTANIKKDKRKGKIFIDWQRNSSGATVVAPYSLRARKGASVSAPVPWSHLSEFAPDALNIFSDLPNLPRKFVDLW